LGSFAGLVFSHTVLHVECAELFELIRILVEVFSVQLLGGWEKVLAFIAVLEVQRAVACRSQ
jgi:hypothetical protein